LFIVIADAATLRSRDVASLSHCSTSGRKAALREGYCMVLHQSMKSRDVL
jgi:hypothetical protein